MPVDKVCGQCGKCFSVKAARAESAKFCSVECRSKNGSIQKICECCGKDFTVPMRRHETVRFCSIDCKTEGRRKMVECEVCKKPFSCEAHKDRKFCSRLCFHAASKGSTHAVDPNAARYIKACAVCCKEFRVTLTRKDTALYCSNACKVKDPAYLSALSERMSGENSWRWTGGLYKTHRGYVRHKVMRLGKETVSMSHRQIMLAWMLEVAPDHQFIIEVDGTKKISPNIEVHHIDRVRSNNDRTNLLAVTKFAHSQIHHRNRKPEPWECWPSNPVAW